MTVSRGTLAEPRLSVRVGHDLKSQIPGAAAPRPENKRERAGRAAPQLSRGLRELPPDRLHELIVEMRQEQAS